MYYLRSYLPTLTHWAWDSRNHPKEKMEMREIFAPISTILNILSLIHQLPQNQISRIAPLLGWQVCLRWNMQEFRTCCWISDTQH